jgi:hypothetical protein
MKAAPATVIWTLLARGMEITLGLPTEREHRRRSLAPPENAPVHRQQDKRQRRHDGDATEEIAVGEHPGLAGRLLGERGDAERARSCGSRTTPACAADACAVRTTTCGSVRLNVSTSRPRLRALLIGDVGAEPRRPEQAAHVLRTAEHREKAHDVAHAVLDYRQHPEHERAPEKDCRRDGYQRLADDDVLGTRERR